MHDRLCWVVFALRSAMAWRHAQHTSPKGHDISETMLQKQTIEWVEHAQECYCLSQGDVPLPRLHKNQKGVRSSLSQTLHTTPHTPRTGAEQTMCLHSCGWHACIFISCFFSPPLFLLLFPLSFRSKGRQHTRPLPPFPFLALESPSVPRLILLHFFSPLYIHKCVSHAASFSH